MSATILVAGRGFVGAQMKAEESSRNVTQDGTDSSSGGGGKEEHLTLTPLKGNSALFFKKLSDSLID